MQASSRRLIDSGAGVARANGERKLSSVRAVDRSWHAAYSASVRKIAFDVLFGRGILVR